MTGGRACLSRGKLPHEPHSQQLAYQGSRLADARGSRVELGIFLELQAISQEGVQSRARVVCAPYVLLDRLDEELRYLGSAQLVPRQGRLAAAHDQQSDAVLEMIDGYPICIV
jgi:hypothetical protein